MISLIGAPNSTLLLNRIKVKEQLGISGTTYDNLLDELIEQASRLVYDTLGYSAFRCTRRETLRGSRRTELVLRALPVLRIDAASYRGSAIDPTEIRFDANTGIISRDFAFESCGDPSEWTIDYLSGWFLTDDDTSGSISVAESDDSFNSSALFPDYIIAGDRIAAGGANNFTNAANNGSHIVESATTSKIEVASALTDELAGTRDIAVRNVPAELERAAMQCVSVWYRQRTSNSTIKSKSLADVSITYADTGASWAQTLDQDVTRMLGSWRAW